ncbi:indole-3-glycerol phosphate synthase TrpC [Haliovirga abyssi]|uniref:Indole-3-glycerol phosphate synthase n=1 Tax=Haliovirga abyssi TaxID=2996794 RepID=A0AAU9DW68_9FUSO|nr:indole-3-glycerol phosphate synthase TrpC [Haliovirga abyssi]BDU50491.1 indole-3-glycerol phosphate synthase [Haliovirga abyssi]
MILDEIINHKKIEIKKLKSENSLDNFINKIKLFESKFKENLSKKGISIISEVKKASPSKGIIREDFNYLKIAKEYEENGASAISVLTDKKFFQGDSKYLYDISKEVELPTLRKDFIIDEYQIYEAKYLGAHAILLIGEVLDYKTLIKFIELANRLKLGVLLEVHSEEVLKKALDTPAKIIGVNNRNLQTFNVDIYNVIKLREKIPMDRLVVAESGIKSREDIKLLEKNYIDAALIGETLMKSKNIGKKLLELLGR